VNRRAWLLIAVIGGATMLVFAPLLSWLGRTSLRVDQLTTGGLLVVLALIFSLRDNWATLRPQPQFNRQGIALLAWGLICLGLTGFAKQWALPLALLSFCLCVTAVVALLFGRVGVGQFLPAIGALFVFGMLAGIAPNLDWPLRALAGKQAGNLLAILQQPVELAVAHGRPAELLLHVGNAHFIVATECNGFGLLTSALIVATILGFQQRLPWLSKIGLIALAVPVALTGNFLRIVGIALTAPRVPLSYGFVHEVIGLFFYIAGLALIWFAARQPKENKPCSSSMSTST
jgi:exosortase/archaeosortase family protein